MTSGASVSLWGAGRARSGDGEGPFPFYLKAFVTCLHTTKSLTMCFLLSLQGHPCSTALLTLPKYSSQPLLLWTSRTDQLKAEPPSPLAPSPTPSFPTFKQSQLHPPPVQLQRLVRDTPTSSPHTVNKYKPNACCTDVSMKSYFCPQKASASFFRQ